MRTEATPPADGAAAAGSDADAKADKRRSKSALPYADVVVVSPPPPLSSAQSPSKTVLSQTRES